MHYKLFIKIFINQYYINKKCTQCLGRLSRGPISCLIVYYAPRKKKLGPTTTRVNHANTSCGLANFSHVVHILFFVISGPKIPHSRSCAGRECGNFGHDITKNNLLIMVRALVRHWMALPNDIAIGYFHAPVSQGELGIPSLRWLAPLQRKDCLLGLVPGRRMEKITDPYLAKEIG